MPEELAGKNKICSASSLEGVKFTYEGTGKVKKCNGIYLADFFYAMAMLVIPQLIASIDKSGKIKR